MKTIEQWQRWLTENTTGAWKSGTVTYVLWLVPRFMIGTWHALVIALVSIVLLPWLALVFLLSHGSKPSTFPVPSRQRLPRPFREGSDIFLEMQDGTVIPIDPMMASILAEEWVGVIKGAYVYEKTKLPR